VANRRQTVIGRERKRATFFSRCPFNSGGLGSGFAPRKFRRSANTNANIFEYA